MNRPAPYLPTVRAIQRYPTLPGRHGYEYDPSRNCHGKRGLCRTLPTWVVTHSIRRGYRRSFYCAGCLPAKHREATELIMKGGG